MTATVDVQQVRVPAHRVREKQHDPASLAKSMAEHGLINPITLRADLTLIAGYHRLAAAKLLGWTQIAATILQVDDDEAELVEIDENLRRHDLTVWEQSKHIARREAIMRARGERAAEGGYRRNDSATVAESPPTTPEIAEAAGMSERTYYRRAKTGSRITPEVARVLDDLDPQDTSLPDSTRQLDYLAGITDPTDQLEVATRVADGNARDVWEASKQLKREREKQEREARRRENAENAPKLTPTNARHTLYHAPCAAALDLPAGSVDWVITDPPYPKEYLPVYDDLARVAAHVLRPGGSLLCMIGQSYVPEIVAKLAATLDYHWTLAYLTPGGQATQLFPRRVNTFWKPVLWFTKGAYDGEWIGDVTRSAPNDNDKTRHHWGQSESGMGDLMQRFVKEGDRVLDPFMGAATTGMVALALGATFVGYDLAEDSYNEAIVRLADADV